MQTPVESNGWRIEEAEFVVVRDGLKSLKGRYLFDAVGISVNQTLSSIDVIWSTKPLFCAPFKLKQQNNFLILSHALEDLKYILQNNNSVNIFNKNTKMVEEYLII